MWVQKKCGSKKNSPSAIYRLKMVFLTVNKYVFVQWCLLKLHNVNMQDLGRVFLSIQSLVEKATIYFDWSALMQTVAKVGFTRASKMHCVPTLPWL